jgi:hypothetical protein
MRQRADILRLRAFLSRGVSNSTFWFSSSDLQPEPAIAEKQTNTSAVPSSGAAPAGRADDDSGLAALAVPRPDPGGSSTAAAQPPACPGSKRPPDADLSGLISLRICWARRVRSGPYFVARYLGMQMYRRLFA